MSLATALSAFRLRRNAAVALGPDTATYDTAMFDEVTVVERELPPGPEVRRVPARMEDEELAAIRPAEGGATADSGASAAAGMRLPRLGTWPLKLQIRIWLPTLLIALAVTFVLLQVDSRQAGDAANWYRQLGEAQMQSQRVAKAASQAIAGDALAFGQLSNGRAAMAGALSALARGTDDERAVPAQVAPDLRTLQLIWSQSDGALKVILDQDLLLQSISGMRTDATRVGSNLLANAQLVLANRLQANASPRELAAAMRLVTLTQGLMNDISELFLGSVPIRTVEPRVLQATGELAQGIDGFLNGNRADGLTRIADEPTRLALMEARQSLIMLSPQIDTILASQPALQRARQAERHVFADSEIVQALLDAVRGKLQARESLRLWNMVGAVGFGLLALLALYGLFRAFLHESEGRALEAERQESAARRQEQQARETNDRNQAAILRLMNELQEVADGDLTVQATVSEDITGAIADSVNYTVEELRNLVGRINKTVDEVRSASTRAQEMAVSLQSASEQQSQEIRESGQAVLRMARQIDDVSVRASESVQVARQSLDASKEGSTAVDNAIAGMNGIRDQIQDTAKRMKRLGESSQEIGEIVELISDITEQTNVLALNAAIQAASAGEAGRGFSVVAEEVQRLAERSGDATRQIAALIRAIQTDTQDAVSAMERSTQGVVEGTRLSDEAGRALGEIGRVSTALAELIEEFSSTTSRQAASAGDVAHSIERILQVTEQTSAGTLQTADSVRQLSELALELRNSVARFKVA